MLSACCSSSNVKLGKIGFYVSDLNNPVTVIEIPAGEFADLKLTGADGFYRYSPTCTVQIEKPELLRAQMNSRVLQLEAIAPGQSRVDVQCGGDSAGEFALCSALFQNSGSITVTVKLREHVPALLRLWNDLTR
jgi:hypothetical protein